MTILNQFLQELEQQWRELTQGWWEDDPLGRLHDQSDRLRRRLQGRYQWLICLRASIEGLRERLAENEKRLPRLAELVGVYLHVADRDNAWKYALEHNSTRQAVERDTVRLQRRERAYRDQLADLQRLQRRLARLQEAILVRQHQRSASVLG
jgi:paraquat-inducible protein B